MTCSVSPHPTSCFQMGWSRYQHYYLQCSMNAQNSPQDCRYAATAATSPSVLASAHDLAAPSACSGCNDGGHEHWYSHSVCRAYYSPLQRNIENLATAALKANSDQKTFSFDDLLRASFPGSTSHDIVILSDALASSEQSKDMHGKSCLETKNIAEDAGGADGWSRDSAVIADEEEMMVLEERSMESDASMMFPPI